MLLRESGRKERRRGPLVIMVMVVVVYHLAPPWSSQHRGHSRPMPRAHLPQVGEMLAGWLNPAVTVDLLAYGTLQAAVSLPRAIPDPVDAHYVKRLLPPHPLDISKEVMPLGSRLRRVQDFFAFLKTPQRNCRKLVMVGGYHQCGVVAGNIPDGRKAVCLDPALEMPPDRLPQSCLTLSFGIQKDTSFDAGMAAMNCEVHMFDLLDFTPAGLLRRVHHAHFHQVGLAEERKQRYYLNLGKEIAVDSLAGHLRNNSLTHRAIHVLKMDIEGDEWSVLRQLANDPVMDLIGQIAIEIHSENLLILQAKKHLGYLQYKYDVLKAIETRGFKKITYWDNPISKVYHDVSGASYSTCGEIHYVNTNWYDSAFKTRLKRIGIHFK